ncbi:hypothetical protein RJZ90_000660 [Blastomyces dermatitidis]
MGYFIRGRHLSYQRGKRATNPNTSLIKLEGVDDTKAANFYLGKKVAFVYRAKREVQGSKIRVIWGKVTRTHGMSFSIPKLAGLDTCILGASPVREVLALDEIATRASSALNSDTTSPPSHSVPAYE